MLDQMKVPELKALAKEKGIEGADSMKKSELVAALESAAENKSAADKPKSDYQKHQESWQSRDELKAERSSSENSDIQKHPKFAKFKSHLGVKHHDK